MTAPLRAMIDADLTERLDHSKINFIWCKVSDLPKNSKRGYWLMVDGICIGQCWRLDGSGLWRHSFCGNRTWPSRGFAVKDLLETVASIDKEIDKIQGKTASTASFHASQKEG